MGLRARKFKKKKSPKMVASHKVGAGVPRMNMSATRELVRTEEKPKAMNATMTRERKLIQKERDKNMR